VADLASRLASRVQITSDGHMAYLEAVEAALGADVDYAQLIKVYGPSPEAETRYSLVECIGTETKRVTGSPNPSYISTSYVERQNLTMRMSMQRFTRPTNAFSKKVENLAAAVSLHFMWYNVARPHGSLGKNVTPAMAAGVSDHVWTADEIAGLLEG
jgi:hypothetical protein